MSKYLSQSIDHIHPRLHASHGPILAYCGQISLRFVYAVPTAVRRSGSGMLDCYWKRYTFPTCQRAIRARSLIGNAATGN